MIDTITINGERVDYRGSLEIRTPRNLKFTMDNGVLVFEEDLDEEQLLMKDINECLEAAFKNSTVKKIPIALFGTVPKYECQGEEIADDMYDILDEDWFLDELIDSTTYDGEDLGEVYEDFGIDGELFERLRKYNDREDTLVVAVKTDTGVKLEFIDYGQEIGDMW